MCNVSVYLKNQKESHRWTLSTARWPVMIFVWPSEKAGRAHVSQASLGQKAVRGGWGGCRETACVFWAQRCATAGVGVHGFSSTLFTLHTFPRGRCMETSLLCERRDGVSETYDTKPLSSELQRFNPPGLASESMIFIIKMPRKRVCMLEQCRDLWKLETL